MFTGLVEAIGEIVAVEQRPGAVRIYVTSEIGDGVSIGDSVSVNGVCLTAIEGGGRELAFDAGPETMRVTGLGELAPGDRVNLERAMRADTRLGGHFVQGHVDAVGTVVDVRPDGEFTWVRIRFPQELAPQLVLKGSIAVDGISLTVAALGEDFFDVQIIPHTWTHTNLRGAHAGMRVNLECDIIGKYVARAMSLMTAAQGAPRS
jgi:riboflavin synthase